MISLKIVLLVIALLCVLLAALNVSAPRINLGWLGLALWLAAVIVG